MALSSVHAGILFFSPPTSVVRGSLLGRQRPLLSPADSRVLEDESVLGPVDEESLCRNYYCCDEFIVDLHGLLQHIEDRHVHDSHDDDDYSGSPEYFDADPSGLDGTNFDSDHSSPSSPCASPSHESYWTRELEFSPGQVVPRFRGLNNNNNNTASNGQLPRNGSKNGIMSSTSGSITVQSGLGSGSSLYAKNSNAVNSGSNSGAGGVLGSSGARRTANGSVKRPLAPSSTAPTSFKRSKSSDNLVPSNSRPGSPAGGDVSDSESGMCSGRTSPFKPSMGGLISGHGSISGDSEFKPYRCPFHACGKSYKNANGLKYHMNHGHTADAGGGKSVEKPYVCPIPGCDKKYKNPNGLKYHIAHSHQAVAEQALAALGAAFLNATSEGGSSSASGYLASAASSPSGTPLGASSPISAAAAAAALAAASMGYDEDALDECL